MSSALGIRQNRIVDNAKCLLRKLVAGKGRTLDAVVKLVRRGNGVLLAHGSRLALDVYHVDEDSISEFDLVRLKRRSLMLGLGCSFDPLRIGDP